MNATVTWIVAAIALAIALFAGWRGARKPDPNRPPRLVPWRLIMVLAAAVLLYMIVHLVNLAGVDTGR
ncbi:MAG TPA: hypothetical protein VF559_12840 [Caulobacteraceae bacterium]